MLDSPFKRTDASGSSSRRRRVCPFDMTDAQPLYHALYL